MSTKTTEEILSHHLQSFGEGNVDELMKDYTEESIVIAPDKTLRGMEQIRPLFENFVTKILPPGCTFEMLKQEIKENVAYIAWEAESDNYKIHLGTDTLIIKDGKISVQTFAAHIEQK